MRKRHMTHDFQLVTVHACSSTVVCRDVGRRRGYETVYTREGSGAQVSHRRRRSVTVKKNVSQKSWLSDCQNSSTLAGRAPARPRIVTVYATFRQLLIGQAYTRTGRTEGRELGARTLSKFF